MSELEDLLPYDDEESLKYIKQYLPADIRETLSEDEIYYIVDTMYDYYESAGFFSEESEDTGVDIDEDLIVEYVFKQVKKDKIYRIPEESVRLVVLGELDYCDSIGMFD